MKTRGARRPKGNGAAHAPVRPERFLGIPDPPTAMGVREYARHRGVSHKAVQKALAADRIPVRQDGLIDPAAADVAWDVNTDLSKPRNTVFNGRNDLGSASNPPESPQGNPSGHAPMPDSPYLRAQIALVATRARILQIEADKRAGRLVDVSVIREAVERAVRKMKEHMLGVPSRVAARCAASSDKEECRKLIENEIERALRELNGALIGS